MKTVQLIPWGSIIKKMTNDKKVEEEHQSQSSANRQLRDKTSTVTFISLVQIISWPELMSGAHTHPHAHTQTHAWTLSTGFHVSFNENRTDAQSWLHCSDEFLAWVVFLIDGLMNARMDRGGWTEKENSWTYECHCYKICQLVE